MRVMIHKEIKGDEFGTNNNHNYNKGKIFQKLREMSKREILKKRDLCNPYVLLRVSCHKRTHQSPDGIWK